MYSTNIRQSSAKTYLVSLPSDNIPSNALPGNESQYGVQSISQPHGPRHGPDARAAAQYSPAGPWESHQPGSHGQRHLHTKTRSHRQAGGMQHATHFYVWPTYDADQLCLWLGQVCREFQRGNCTRGESECRYAHPLEAGMVDCSENSVIVCMDYIKGRCNRDKCKYFHPPAHLQARIKAAQHQASQNTAPAALVSPFQHYNSNKYWVVLL